MANETDNLVLEQLRLIRRGQDEMRLEFGDLKSRINAMETSLGQVTTQLRGVQTQIAVRNGGLDRIEERLTRIERRLDLTDA